jgi:hypothetical protein
MKENGAGHALDWNRQGSRKKSRPKITWKRTTEGQKSWKEAKGLTLDTTKWKRFTKAIYST